MCVCFARFPQVVTDYSASNTRVGIGIDNMLYYNHTKTRYQLITKRVLQAYNLFFL